MADTRPIPIRISRDLIRRLDKASSKLGVNRSGVIRFCVETFLDHLDQHGKVFLPVDWKDILNAMDGRRKVPNVDELKAVAEQVVDIAVQKAIEVVHAEGKSARRRRRAASSTSQRSEADGLTIRGRSTPRSSGTQVTTEQNEPPH